jgi:O-acetyl-ADP-ribose deacetylase (regulator of RNase III)
MDSTPPKATSNVYSTVQEARDAAYDNAVTVGEQARIDYPRFVAEAVGLPRDYVAAKLTEAWTRTRGDV